MRRHPVQPTSPSDLGRERRLASVDAPHDRPLRPLDADLDQPARPQPAPRPLDSYPELAPSRLLADPGRGREEGSRDPRGGIRGVLVELVRLIVVAVLAVSGWEVAVTLFPDRPREHLVGIVIGSGLGYVLGGAFGRRTASAVTELEREFRRRSAAEVLASAIGLVFGLTLSTLISLPLFHLPTEAAYPAVAFVYVTLGYVGHRVGRTKSDELFALFGVKPRAAGTRPGEVAVLDSSAILDGRLTALIQMGFLAGTLLVTRSVLEELQAVADSSSPSRRARGRRALDRLVALRRDPSVDLVLVEDEPRAPGEPVDTQLVRLARARGGALVTNDAGLARVAAALDVPVRSIHALADALRPEVVGGDLVSVRLTRRGRESGQAVGYLDDGTMVVVEEADHLLGHTVTVRVTNPLQTSAGRMIFARVAGEGGLGEDGEEQGGDGEEQGGDRAEQGGDGEEQGGDRAEQGGDRAERAHQGPTA